MKKAFTLIELLIVIGILSVLAVTILITLNPSEAQKKARDTKRMKDMATLQSIIEQYINDGNPPITASGCPSNNPFAKYDSGALVSVCNSTSAGNVQSQTCSSNWLGVNLCNYSKTIPVDPANARACTYTFGTVAAPQTQVNGQCYYTLVMSGSDYKMSTLQESKSNIGNVVNDGGTHTHWAEVGSNLQLW